MSVLNKNASVKRAAFVSNYEIGTNSTSIIHKAKEKLSVVKKIIITNNTSIAGTIDISYHKNNLNHGGNNFVVLGYDNGGPGTTNVAYSTDGVTWTQSSLPVPGYWTGGTYGNGKYLAVPYWFLYNGEKRAVYSTNGIIWSSSTMPSSGVWLGVVYGNGKFISVAGYNGAISAASTDGITWTLGTAPMGMYGRMVFGNGLFATFNYDGAGDIISSTNGISWTKTNLPNPLNDTGGWNSLIYGNGIFLLTRNGPIEKAIYMSTDTISWTNNATISATNFYPSSMSYGNGTFLLSNNGIVHTSTNGINWVSSGASTYWDKECMTYGNNRFIGINPSTYTTGYYSTNGITWSTTTVPNFIKSVVLYPENSDLDNFSYIYKAVSVPANSTITLKYEMEVEPSAELRGKSTVPMQITVVGDSNI